MFRRYPLSVTRVLLSVFLPLTLNGCFLFGSEEKPEDPSSATPEPVEEDAPAKELGAADKLTSQAPEGDLFRAAQRLYQTQMFTLARQSFQTLHDQYPMGAYGMFSEVKLADTYFFNREFTEASKRYEEFARNYPASPDLPYVRLQAARSLILASKGGGRDRAPHEKALTLLDSIITQHPNTAYAAIADKERLKVAEELSSHDRMVIDFYTRRENIAAVEAREKQFKQRWASVLKPKVSSQIILDGPMVPLSSSGGFAHVGPSSNAQASNAQASNTLSSEPESFTPAESDLQKLLPPIPVAVVRREDFLTREEESSPALNEPLEEASGEMALASAKAATEDHRIPTTEPARASANLGQRDIGPKLLVQRVICRDQGHPFATIELAKDGVNLPPSLTQAPIEPVEGLVILKGIKLQSVQPVFDCFAEGDLRISADHVLELDSDVPVAVSTLSNPARLILIPE